MSPEFLISVWDHHWQVPVVVVVFVCRLGERISFCFVSNLREFLSNQAFMGGEQSFQPQYLLIHMEIHRHIVVGSSTISIHQVTHLIAINATHVHWNKHRHSQWWLVVFVPIWTFPVAVAIICIVFWWTNLVTDSLCMATCLLSIGIPIHLPTYDASCPPTCLCGPGQKCCSAFRGQQSLPKSSRDRRPDSVCFGIIFSNSKQTWAVVVAKEELKHVIRTAAAVVVLF